MRVVCRLLISELKGGDEEMNAKQKLSLGGALVLPLAAAAFVVLAPATLRAETECLYAGKPYSLGACIPSVCAPTYGQKCIEGDEGGEWSGCTLCNDPG
jgi:hypothetical protein